MTSIDEARERYEASRDAEKARIRKEPKRSKRALLWARYAIASPFKWLWVNIRDWRTALAFGIWAALLSSPVWGFYLLGAVTWGTELSGWAMGIASAAWLFWLGPGTPFLPLCIGLTMATQAIWGKIREWKRSRRK